MNAMTTASDNTVAGLSKEQTLHLLRERLKEKGDMPIFSASVNRVHLVGSDPEADAMALSVEILKDANLTTKVLKLANSPLYNRGQGKIGNLSRAVVLLGFEVVKSVVLTVKLIDSFQKQFPGIDMTGMLVNAFLSGGFVRGISSRCGVKDIEQAYICGLLHNLGEVVVAYALPDQFRGIITLQREQAMPRRKAEHQVLGVELAELGQDVLSGWGFPQSMVRTLGAGEAGASTRIRNQVELTGALSSLASQTMGLLYAEHPDSQKSLRELKYELAKVAGIKGEEVSEALEQSFKESCELAKTYGLSRQHLMPRLRGNADEDLEKLARQFSFYASSEISDGTNSVSTSTPTSTAEAVASDDAPGGAMDANLLLSILFEITGLMTQKAHINSILDKVLEGIQRGVGFDRAVLCLLTPDHGRYVARMAKGQGTEQLKEYFNFPINSEGDLFSKIIMEGNELFVPDIRQGGWQQQLPPGFGQTTGAYSFMVASLRSRTRPLGMFFADKSPSGVAITREQQASFNQLVAQARLALQMR
ncbi:MAG: HDOD domain-containing protein [Gammaproteobacteria bacterium]|nr:HDOD domain-containing protein [Gammaproteobacteria bacterium]